jgi:hypothetical protein
MLDSTGKTGKTYSISTQPIPVAVVVAVAVLEGATAALAEVLAAVDLAAITDFP